MRSAALPGPERKKMAHSAMRAMGCRRTNLIPKVYGNAAFPFDSGRGERGEPGTAAV
jgi:hypothetical protein